MAHTFNSTEYLAFQPTEAPYVLVRKELTAQGATGDVTDMGIDGLKHVRVRVMIKSGMSNGNTFRFSVAVSDTLSTGALVDPEVVAIGPLMNFVTNDTYLTCEVQGWSWRKFRYVQIRGTDSGGTASYDAIIDAW